MTSNQLPWCDGCSRRTPWPVTSVGAESFCARCLPAAQAAQDAREARANSEMDELIPTAPDPAGSDHAAGLRDGEFTGGELPAWERELQDAVRGLK